MFHCQLPRSTGLLAAAFVLLLNVRTEAQDKSATPPIRSTTRVVTTNVVVTDHQGNPIRNLGQDDFVLLDGGQPQKVAFFSVVDNEQKSASGRPRDPDTYANTSIRTRPSVTILLFDTLNSRWTSQGYGLHRIRNLLRQIEPQDYIGIYVLGDDLKVVQDFREDSAELYATIRRYDDLHSPSPVVREAAKERPDENTELARFLAGKDNRYRFEMGGLAAASPSYIRAKQATSVQVTAASLGVIARQLFSVPGRKTLIWVTDSIGPMTNFDLDNADPFLQQWRDQAKVDLPNLPSWMRGLDVERLIRLMNEAGIAVYTVDAKGLQTRDLGFGNPSAAPAAIGDSPEPNPDLLELASRTGGRAFFNRNDLETGIRRALDDARLTYELGYYPDHNQWNGQWRKIQVKVNRPEVTVLARGGYFALPDPRPISGKNRYEFLSQIAASPVDATQLPLSVHLAATSAAKGPHLDAKVHLSPQSMLTQQANGHWQGNFEVVFMQIGEKNKLLDLTQEDVDGDLDQAGYAAAAQQGWDLAPQLKFMPGASFLCVIVRDKASDAVGSVRIPLARYAAQLTAH